MIFGNLISGGFGILMPNMSQVQNILLFQGCEKIVLRLYTAGTENPDNPKHIRVPLISMNITMTPPNTHQTSPRHPTDMSREQETPPDTNKQLQTPKDTDKCCLSTSGSVCWRLLTFLAPWICLGGVWGVYVGCLMGIWGYLNGIHGNLRRSDVFWGIWVLSPCSMEP